MCCSIAIYATVYARTVPSGTIDERSVETGLNAVYGQQQLPQFRFSIRQNTSWWFGRSSGLR
jgi:hypothetical protein